MSKGSHFFGMFVWLSWLIGILWFNWTMPKPLQVIMCIFFILNSLLELLNGRD